MIPLGICNILRLRPNRRGSSLTTVYYHLRLLSHGCILINALLKLTTCLSFLMDINYGIKLQSNNNFKLLLGIVVIINIISMVMMMNDLNKI